MHRSKAVRLCMLCLVLILAACSAPAAVPATATALPAATEAQPSTATPAPSATPEPSATPAPSATAAPTSTPEATATTAPTFGPAEDGFSAFCLPEDAVLAETTDLLNPPAYARPAEMVDGALEVNNLPVSACTFLYTFNGPAPEGLTLALYELNQASPWLTAPLEPVAGAPNTLAATLRHTYIVAPPLWNVSYEFAVQDGQGGVLRRDPVNLHRWVPTLCFNGQPPDVNTLRCPLWQDLHPWDAGYGTVIPTYTLEPGE